MRDSNHPVPAIQRPYNDDDRNAEVLTTPKSTVTFSPGVGDSGYRIQTVAYECPNEQCSHNRMVRHHRVNPHGPDYVEYYCLNPNCGHFLEDKFEYAFRGRNTKSKPTIKEDRQA